MVKSTFENLNEEKKKRIEQSLLKEFSNHSLADAQVARIVKDAQIARGAFYKYFDNLTDAYLYIFHKALESVHSNIHVREFNVDAFYQSVKDFLEKSSCEYCDLFKMHYAHNSALLQTKPSEWTLKMQPEMWSAMVLTHETLKNALLDPEHQNEYLDLYKKSLEMLNRGKK